MAPEETPLEKARRHVVEGRKIVARQRQLIADLKRKGLPTADAESVLRTFENNLAIFERDERDRRAKRDQT